MIYSREIPFVAGAIAIIETDPDANFYQLKALGSTGSLTIEAQTFEDDTYEQVYTDNSGATQASLNMSNPLTATIANTKIIRFRLTPVGALADYKIIINQWRG